MVDNDHNDDDPTDGDNQNGQGGGDFETASELESEGERDSEPESEPRPDSESEPEHVPLKHFDFDAAVAAANNTKAEQERSDDGDDNITFEADESAVEELAPQEPISISKRNPWLRGVYWFAVVSVWFGIGLGFFAIYLAVDLPDLDALPPPGEHDSIEIRANDGSIMVTYGAVNGENLPPNEIPLIMKQAIVSIEDRRFFEHGGFDVRSFFRALWANISYGGVRQGASTISQQLAKNIFLSQQRTLKRKVQELFLALWLEQKFSKDAILTLYLNRVYFGSGTYGIEAASQKFFGHGATNLNVGEAALLAGLVKAPSRLSPLRNKDAAYDRARIVLSAMASAQYIDDEAMIFWRQNPPYISLQQAGGEDRYFTDWILERLEGLVAVGHEPLVIYTSLDPELQKQAVQALRDGLAGGAGSQADIGQGALLALSLDGSVQAMVGGQKYADSQFNRATQALRQPGSAFKPFVYLAAIEKGLNMQTVLEDAPLDIDGWAPNNFSGTFSGPMTVKEGFIRSINTIAVQVSEGAGRQYVTSVARRLGITSSLRAHPSIALGTSEVSLLELASAYTPFANGGLGVKPYGILEVRSNSGALLYRRAQAEKTAVIRPQDLQKIIPLLEGVVGEGTGRAAKLDEMSAGKTGTSQNYRDAWFMGFTDNMVAGVWLGNDDNSPMVRVTGGGLPARIWHQFMENASGAGVEAR